ncbi:hypothetical protein KDW36_08010 [Burkholderia dolosa]|uniref:InvB/SpaK family type III secretion system chaperone n=1 Tax=Burkholderia dolosa TaxID=152500 RepID=UPI001B92ED7B|nr:hypothetical protein [Burkholderia dolosa]MBR8313143.1 hypothetical protein [Burkholderia dolosa]
MQGNDIGTIVRAALNEAGCDSNLIDDLDPRATVEIALKDTPTIYIGYKNDDESSVMIWSSLCDYHESVVRAGAYRFLEELMKGVSFAVGEQLMFREVAGELQISAEIRPDLLESPPEMAAAIQEFFDALVQFVEIAKQ